MAEAPPPGLHGRVALPRLQASSLHSPLLAFLLTPDSRLSMLHGHTRREALPGCMGQLQGMTAGTTPPPSAVVMTPCCGLHTSLAARKGCVAMLASCYT